jgi:hypothetical protein
MLARSFLGSLIVMFAVTQAGYADGGGDISRYFNKTAIEVKATTDPVQKRDILHNSLEKMSEALSRIENSGLVPHEDREGAKRLKTSLQEKQDELNGANSFERVPDAQLNSFVDYVVQDMEQADRYVTVSLVTVLLIVIILILIL